MQILSISARHPPTFVAGIPCREALGLSQRQFAERLRVHTVTVAKWEADMQGMRGPAEQLIELLGQSAGVPASRKNPRRRKKSARRGSKNKKTAG